MDEREMKKIQNCNDGGNRGYHRVILSIKKRKETMRAIV